MRDGGGGAIGGGTVGAAARERAEQLVGTVIADRYRIHNVLAMGGMGAVYTGEHVHMRKRVAVKILHPDTEGLPGLVARFEREAIVGAHVEHANVASARDFGRLKDGSYYLVLEFVRGATLRKILHKGALPSARAVRIAKQIAAALAAVHGRGILHRDLAPRNVMVVEGSDDRVKLIDFGFAKVPVEKFAALSVQQGLPMGPSEITAPGVIFGTIGYLAPEAAQGMAAVTDSSDLYALGAILYEMLAGVPPFDAPNQAALFLKHKTDPVPPISERAPGVHVPPALEAIAQKLLAKAPADRYASASGVVRALDLAAAEIDPESRPPPAFVDEISVSVAGEESPGSLPRFEDVVTEGTPQPSVSEVQVEADDEPPQSAKRTAPPAAPSSRKTISPKKAPPVKTGSPWLTLLTALVVVAGGAVAFVRFVGWPGAHAGRTTTPPATAPPSAASSAGPEAVASGVPFASQAAASAPRPTAVAGLDAEAWKRVVRLVPSTGNYASAVEGLLALAELDPSALDTAEMKNAAFDVTVNAGLDKEKGDKVLAALATGFGTDGPDVLYEVLTRRGGSKSAEVAGELLRRPDVRERGSAALRVALDLRDAPCEGKPALMDRVRAEGDARSLVILSAARSPDCTAAAGSCCLRDNPAVETAVRELTLKTKKP